MAGKLRRPRTIVSVIECWCYTILSGFALVFASSRNWSGFGGYFWRERLLLEVFCGCPGYTYIATEGFDGAKSNILRGNIRHYMLWKLVGVLCLRVIQSIARWTITPDTYFYYWSYILLNLIKVVLDFHTKSLRKRRRLITFLNTKRIVYGLLNKLIFLFMLLTIFTLWQNKVSEMSRQY